jgi:hypothetical protein
MKIVLKFWLGVPNPTIKYTGRYDVLSNEEETSSDLRLVQFNCEGPW